MATSSIGGDIAICVVVLPMLSESLVEYFGCAMVIHVAILLCRTDKILTTFPLLHLLKQCFCLLALRKYSSCLPRLNELST